MGQEYYGLQCCNCSVSQANASNNNNDEKKEKKKIEIEIGIDIDIDINSNTRSFKRESRGRIVGAALVLRPSLTILDTAEQSTPRQVTRGTADCFCCCCRCVHPSSLECLFVVH